MSCTDLRVIDVRGGFCPRCGELTDNHNGWYARTIRTMHGNLTAVIHRLRCHLCGAALPSPGVDEVERRRWYGKDIMGYCIDERIRKGQTTRTICIDVRIRTAKRLSPANSTIFFWCLAASAKVCDVEEYQIYPKIPPQELAVVHIDEFYHPALGKKRPIVQIITPKHFCISLKLLPDVDKDQINRLLRRCEAKTSRLDVVVSDGSEIYPPAISQLDHKVKHLGCEFHMKRNMGRHRRELKKTRSRKEKRRLISLIRGYKKALKAQAGERAKWHERYGTEYITNNTVEQFTRHVRRPLRQACAFGDYGKGNAHTELIRFQWNSHEFIAGQHKGKSPLELMGVHSNRMSWVEMLGYSLPTF